MKRILISFVVVIMILFGYTGCSSKNIVKEGLMDDPVCPRLNKENITKDDLEKSISIKKEMVLNHEDIYLVYEDILSKYNDTSEPSRFINEHNIEKINNTEIGGYLISLKMQKSNLYENILDELDLSNPFWCKKQSYKNTIKEYKALMRLK